LMFLLSILIDESGFPTQDLDQRMELYKQV
jgi:hypothetical protein